MSAATVKILLVLAYLAFVIISKAVKASRQARAPGGMPFPQSAPRLPHPMAGPTVPRPRPQVRRRPAARPRPAPPARVTPIQGQGSVPARKGRSRSPEPVRRPGTASKPVQDAEGPEHDATHPVEAHVKPVETQIAPAVPEEREASALARLLTGRDDLRKGVLLAEVLGPPLALR